MISRMPKVKKEEAQMSSREKCFAIALGVLTFILLLWFAIFRER